MQLVFENMEKFLEKYEKFREVLYKSFKKAVHNTGMYIQYTVQDTAPKRSGLLRASFGHYRPSLITDPQLAARADLAEGSSWPIWESKNKKDVVRLDVGTRSYYAWKQEHRAEQPKQGKAPFFEPAMIHAQWFFVEQLQVAWKQAIEEFN